ncbi:MAG: CRISPR-associated protein, partial [Nostoc sp.]
MSQKKNDNNIPNYYLYGTVLTRYGLASLNHDIRRGNKTILQKGYWNGKIHSFVGSSAIRWALRFYLQKQGYLVNRVWNEDEHINRLTSEDFDPEQFYDDDIFG